MKKIKKIKEKLNKNIVLGISLLVLGLVTGIGILSTGYNILASVNPFNLAAGDVTYSNLSTSKKNVQDSIDELYNKVSTWIDPSYIDFGTLATNTNKTILTSSAGICIKRNNKVSCMNSDIWNVEKDHIQQIFSDVGLQNTPGELGCIVKSTYVRCYASDFSCGVLDGGGVYCCDNSDDSCCSVYSDSSVSCYTQ